MLNSSLIETQAIVEVDVTVDGFESYHSSYNFFCFFTIMLYF
jgi:hypothetical protein